MAQQTSRFVGLIPQELPLGGYSQARTHSNLRLRPMPTQETQELYDNMKRTERELDLDERIRLQGGQSSDGGQLDNLEPPTPSQATTMSRTSSVHSLTHSAAYSGAPIDIAEVVEQEERAGPARKRAVRHGPLDKYTKARAALLRKLGACDSCRERKVKCTHHDLSEFEKYYQLARQPQLVPQLRPAISPLSSHNGYHPSLSQLSTQSPFSNPQAFLHIGGHIANNSSSVLQHPGLDEQNGPAVELDRMLQDMADDPTPQATAPPPAPLYGMAGQAETFFTLPTLYPPTFIPTKTVGNPFAAPKVHYLPICRCVDGVWECQWSDGTDSSECGSDPDVCGLRHRELEGLSNHFWNAHAHFRDAEPPFFWICAQCRLKWTEQVEVCPQLHCSGHQTFEQWYFGQVTVPPTRSSPSSIRLSSHGAPLTKPPPSPAGASSIGPYRASPSTGNGSVSWMGGVWGGRISQFRTENRAWVADPSATRGERAKSVSVLPHWKSHAFTRFPDHAVCFGLEHPLLVCFVVLYCSCLIWSESYSALRNSSVQPAQIVLSILSAVYRHVQLWSTICIVVGLVAMGLYKHARFRLNQPSLTSSHHRCYCMRDLFGTSTGDVEQARLDSPGQGHPEKVVAAFG